MPKVLVASALLWPNAARLCGAFGDVGFDVGAIGIAKNPVHVAKGPNRTFVYRPESPLDSLREAVMAYRPDVIIPCDDRVLGHLRTLRRIGGAELATLIETSLGRGGADGALARRGTLAEIGRLSDVNVPQTDTVESLADLRAWARKHGLPAILKLDGSWGGADIAVVRKESELRRAFLTMRLRRSVFRSLKRYLVDHDEEAFAIGPSRAISVQALVPGRAANAAVACWRGEVVSQVAVEVVQSAGPCGIATVVRVTDGDSMVAAARSICREFDLSGFYGFDFVIDAESGIAKLIEINGRASQICHFPLGPGRDLAAALLGVLSGEREVACRRALTVSEIALFPQEWNRDRRSTHLSSAFHDVPIEDSELARYYGYDLSIAGYAPPHRGGGSADRQLVAPSISR